MFPIQAAPSLRLMPIVIGLLAIGLALANRQLLRLVGLRPLSEVFTTPRYQRSARLTERLGRVFLVLFGLGFLIEGLGAYFPQPAVARCASLAVLALAGVTLLVMIGVSLFNFSSRG